MVKRKLKSSEPAAKLSKTDDTETVPNNERKEKLVPFGFDEKNCNVIIEAKDKEVHLPSNLLRMATNEKTLTSKMAIDVSSESLVEALSFYIPKNWKDDGKDCK